MNRRQKIIVSVTGIFLVLLILVGLTYAYFLTQIQGNENNTSISVTTANLIVEYGDGNNTLEPEEAIIPDTVVGTKTFTVTNKGNDTSNYVVVIEDVVVTNATTNAPTTFETNDFVYTLTCNKYNRTEYEANPNTAVSTGTCNGVSNETEFPMTGGLVVRDEINVGEVYLYGLTLTYKDNGLDQSNDMNKTLSAKVNIRNEEAYITLANTVKTTFKKGTSINLTTTEAIEDTNTTKMFSYPFTIENTGETHQNITIKLTDIEMDSVLKDVDFRWGLFNSRTGNAVSRGVFADIGNSNELIIYANTIIDAGDEGRDYELKIWVHNDGSGNANQLNKSFKAKLNVTGEAIEYTPESCFTFDSNTGTITDYNYNTCNTDIVIPKIINGVRVTNIGNEAFQYSKYSDCVTDENDNCISEVEITKFIIPSTVENINFGLVFDNTSYKNSTFTLPEGLILLDGSFEECYSEATQIFIPDTITKISGFNVSFALNVGTIVFPNTITEFSYVTYNNGNANIIFTDGIKELNGSGVFDTANIKTIEIPASVTHIDSGFFEGAHIDEIIVRGKTEAPEGFEEYWYCNYNNIENATDPDDICWGPFKVTYIPQ